MRHILVADDHEFTRRGVSELLREEFPGVEVVQAADGSQVLVLLPEQPWDLLVVDLMMPGMTTLELIRRVRGAGVAAPILVLTAVCEPGCVPGLFAAGANGFIQKHRTARDMVTALNCVAAGERYLHTATALELVDQLQAPPPVHKALSERELQVLLCLAQGLSVKAAAAELGIGSKTVGTYVARIREKTGLGSPVEMAHYALREGLV